MQLKKREEEWVEGKERPLTLRMGADLSHPMGIKGTQQHDMEQLRRPITTLTIKVRHLQPPCNRNLNPEF